MLTQKAIPRPAVYLPQLACTQADQAAQTTTTIVGPAGELANAVLRSLEAVGSSIDRAINTLVIGPLALASHAESAPVTSAQESRARAQFHAGNQATGTLLARQHRAADPSTAPEPTSRPDRGAIGLEQHATNGTSTAGANRTDSLLIRSADSLHRTTKKSFTVIRTRSRQYERAARITRLVMIRSGQMTDVAADNAALQLEWFMRHIANHFSQMSDDEAGLRPFMQRRLQRETKDVRDFHRTQAYVLRQIIQRPGATDGELVADAIARPPTSANANERPLDIDEPFIKYAKSLIEKLDWIDWDNAREQISNPLQAINAVHVFHWAHDDAVTKLNGLDWGEQLARGVSPAGLMAAMSANQKSRLDQASLLFTLARQPNTRLSAGTADGTPDVNALPLGEQLHQFRLSFLDSLREEWQLSQMFRSSADRSNIYINHNALANVRGKTFCDIVDDPALQEIPGFNTLDRQVQERLVKGKLDRMGESTEYRFGTLQHGIATVLKRSLQIQHKPVPNTFGTERQLVDRFLWLCRQWDEGNATMLNPRILLAQYLAQGSGEAITSGASTPQQNVASLQTYLAERWLAVYGAPAPFQRRAAALNILQGAFGDSATLDELTQSTAVFRSQVGGIPSSSVPREQTPLDHFMFVADNMLVDDLMVFKGKGLRPRAALQKEEQTYNRNLENNPWVDARAKENLRIVGRPHSDANIAAERQSVLTSFRTETEEEHERAYISRAIHETPLLGNLVRVVEGIYEGDAGKAIGALPVLGPAYEFAAGVVTGDGPRALSAMPIIGSSYQLEEAWTEGDGLDVAMAGAGFLLDVASLGELGTAGRGRSFGPHIVMKEGELPQGHAVGLRNILSVRKTLGVKADDVGRAEAPAERTSRPQSSAPRLTDALGAQRGPTPGDPYAIEAIVNEEGDSITNADESTNHLAFGPKMDAYRVDPPQHGTAPNSDGIYEVGNNHYIKEDDAFYSVIYDHTHRAWRVYDPANGAKWRIPIHRLEGHWRIRQDVGLKGGAPVTQHAVNAIMDRLFVRELKLHDRYRGMRETYVKDNYGRMEFTDRPYESGFDVEGLTHRSEPQVHPESGKTYFDIRTHSSSSRALSYTRELVGAAEFAEDFKRYVKYYQPGTPIRLIACYAGNGNVFSFAQRLANALNVPVKAYKGRIDMLQPKNSEHQHKMFTPFKNEWLRKRWV
jgi:hypothetical protein